MGIVLILMGLMIMLLMDDVTWLDGITVFSICECWLNQDGAPPNSAGVLV